MSRPLDAWKGAFGDEYTRRNTPTTDDIRNRERAWARMLRRLPGWPKDILEVGCGQGLNLRALEGLAPRRTEICGAEPNDEARRAARYVTTAEVINSALPHVSGAAELVFTSGVLIHIPPDELQASMQAIYDASGRYVLSLEYFSPEEREVPYRGQQGLLWTRDYGSLWLEGWPLKLVDYGFFWRPASGLDNLTWWLLEKDVQA